MEETNAIAIFFVCDEVLKALDFKDDPQVVMSDAEVMTFAILAASLHAGNHRQARWSCKIAGYFAKILSKSRLNRRCRRIPMEVWLAIFHAIRIIFGPEKEYAVDSFPVPCCQKSRIDKRKLFCDRKHLGFMASKKQYFCGIRVHMLVTISGIPVECRFAPGAESDLNVLWKMNLDLPLKAKLYADGAYNCFELEDLLREDEQIYLLAKRGKGTKNRRRTTEEEKQISSKRQIVETAFSCITALLPRSLIVRTEDGFRLRVMCAILAYSFSFIR